jgi:hypothetical protein
MLREFTRLTKQVLVIVRDEPAHCLARFVP